MTMGKGKQKTMNKWNTMHPIHPADHLAPRGAKNEQAFSGVNLKWERTSGALYAHSGPTFFTLEHKKEALSRLRPLFAYSGPTFFKF